MTAPRPRASLTRRRLLAGTAAAAAAPLLPACGAPERASHAAVPAAASRPPVKLERPLRVGLVGCGGRGTGAGIQALRVKQEVELVAIADLFPERIEPCLANLREELGPELAERVKVAPERRHTGFSCWAELIEGELDVVLLATPPVFRPAQLALAVERGRHVFCEKPAAVDAPGVRSVLESVAKAREKQLSIVSGFCWRYNVRHRELWRRVHAGQIGDVHAFYSTYLASPNRVVERRPGWSDVEAQVRNWFHVLWLSGDHVVEQAIHSLDKQAWTFGDEPPLSVTATGGRQTRKSGDCWDHFAAAFDYGDGRTAFHQCRQSEGCDYDNSDWIWGTKGKAHVNGWAPLHEITGAEPWEYEGEGNDMYQAEHDELFEAVARGEPVNDGESMAQSTLLGIMTRMSAYSGKTITWQQALESRERLGPAQWSFGDFPLREPAIPGKTAFL